MMQGINSCLYMNENSQYFVVEELCTFKGTCLQMIAPEEAKWRSFETLEEPPFQKIAKYMRNIEYRPQNVRTFSLLLRSFDYLADKIVPLLLEKSLSPKERYSIAIFLEERLKAIRCELFVQGIISPALVLRLIRANMLIDIMKEDHKAGNQLVGLQHLIDQNHKAIMSQQYPKQYQEALTIALLSCSRNQLQGLLSKHDIILEEKRLMTLLRLRLKLQTNNFQAYYDALSKQEPLVQCLLWRRIEATKESFLQVLKKSFGDVPLSWLYKRLGFDAPQLDGWICLKQMKEAVSGVSKGIRLWVSQQGLQLLLS